MGRLTRLFSRISLRLMLFNLLLVFLPVAGVLLLDFYEQHLERAQIQSMFRQARLIVALIQTDPQSRFEKAAPLLRQLVSDQRFRVVTTDGRVLLDSGPLRDVDQEESTNPQKNWLYRFGAAVLKKPLQWIRPVTRPLTSSDAYERSGVLRGSEIQDALVGQRGVEKRVSSQPDRQVMLYTAVPVFRGGRVAGAVLVSQSTDDIREELHEVRLAVFRIFMISVVLACILTLMVSTTIVQPLRQLRKEAGEILDRRGRLRGRFKGSSKHDEIGDLARALERLTHRVEQHQQLAEAFASDVSHEFKNPLASIRMATEMLAQVDSPAERARFLRVAESEIARMENLLAQVREITMIDAEIQNEERAPVDLNALLQRIVEGFRLRERDRVSFDLDIAPSSLTVVASEDRLIQVFENLLDNAVSFTSTGGHIAVSVAHADKTAHVSVHDRGPGIPEEHLGKIFDRFFTYRPDEQKNHRHTGLGLSIVKTIVEGYGGSVHAGNQPEGGAVFEVRLPAQ
ncbi:MAG TPA: ATP-binding protein [Thermoanaerobaculia bacterium]|jgi:two-component system sensor histidine kinase ChvG|nr:ATP-binding protein [Thermoanaerobaculia bacterium]